LIVRFFLGAALLLVAGCSLFDPRDPEEGGTAIDSLAARTCPSNVVYNIRKALAAGPAGIGIYDQNLDDDFLFILDAQDEFYLPCSPNPFLTWSRELEKANVALIFQNYGDIGMGMSLSTAQDSTPVSPPDDPEADSEVKFRSVVYLVSAGDTSFAGSADVYFRDQGGSWTLYKWQDIRPTSGSKLSYGRLKASLASCQ
jgi:hypothetical protein